MSKQIIIYILIVIFAFGIGYIVASQGGGDYWEGWNAAKARLIETGYLEEISETTEIKTIRGIVSAVKDNKISLKINSLDPLADFELDNRIIEVDDNTKIILHESRNDEEFIKEADAFEKGLSENEPMPFIEKKGSLSDIKVGEITTVTAQENIKDKKQFKAVEIIIQ